MLAFVEPLTAGLERSWRHTQPPRWILAGLFIASVGACAEDAPHFGTLRYRSDALEVYASDELQACGGTFSYTEQWLTAFRERMGERASDEQQRLYWASETDFLENDPCPVGHGCAWISQQTAYSMEVPIEHEHAHLELGLKGRPPSIIEEGAAVMFDATTRFKLDEPLRLMDGFEQTTIDADLYAVAGRLSRRIVEQHGLVDYLRLYESLDGEEGFGAVSNALFDITGDDLGLLVAQAENDDCAPEFVSYQDVACAGIPATPWVSETHWRIAVEMDCAGNDVIGPRQGLASVLRRLELPRAGSLSLELFGDEGSRATVRISECGSCYQDSAFGASTVKLRVGTELRREMIAGTYVVRFEAPADGVETVYLDVRASW